MITLNQALHQMEKLDHRKKAVAFSIEFCTADRKKKEGGELITVNGAILNWNRQGVRPSAPDGAYDGDPKKKPNHFRNRTRNLLLPNGQIRKVHISLITMFNGEVVI